jgi:hypothetical protein
MVEQHSEQRPEHTATDVPELSVTNDTYVTISDAARMTGASRTRLYRYLDSGKLDRTTDGRVSVQALLNAGFALKHELQAVTAPADNLSYLLAQYTDVTRQLNESLQDRVDALQEQLRVAHEQLRLSQEREAQLWQMLQPGPAESAASAQRTNDAPRSEPQDAPADVPHATHRVPFADEQAAAAPLPAEAIPSGEHQQWPETEPQMTQPGGFLRRWKS